MDNTRLFLGIDGGGSSTRALVIDAAGVVRGRGESGPSNPNQVGWDGVGRALSEAVSASGVAGPFARVHAGLAGVATDEGRERLVEVIAGLGVAEKSGIKAGHDLEIALAGGLAGRHGIVLVAGTGSACFGRNESGATWQAGGWGPILDDAGSGYWLGLRAIMVAMRAEDGRGPATSLAAAVLAATGASSLREVLARLHSGSLARPAVAALAPLVIEAAQRKDLPAIIVLSLGVSELALMISTVANRLGLNDCGVEVAITGGVGRSPGYQPHIEAAVLKRLPKARCTGPELSSVAGAALLAARADGFDAVGALRAAGC